MDKEVPSRTMSIFELRTGNEKLFTSHEIHHTKPNSGSLEENLLKISVSKKNEHLTSEFGIWIDFNQKRSPSCVFLSTRSTRKYQFTRKLEML